MLTLASSEQKNENFFSSLNVKFLEFHSFLALHSKACVQNDKIVDKELENTRF